MAGLKKSKKDTSSPNVVLVVFLIFFVLLSIGLGVFAYYGQEGQEKLRQSEKLARNEVKRLTDERNAALFLGRESALGIGLIPMTPDEITAYKAAAGNYIARPDDFKDVDPLIKEVRKKNVELLGPFSENDMKYQSTYSEMVKSAKDRASEAESKLAAIKAEYDEFKKNYDKIVTKSDADVTLAQKAIEDGNAAALKAAQVVNNKFPALDDIANKLREDNKKEAERHDAEKKEIEDRLARKQGEVDKLNKQINDRTLGINTDGGGTADTKLHALMLDISRGLPLWDRSLGKIIRVDPSNLLVYIDLGNLRGITAETTFQVFAGTLQGKADRQLKGTLEVVRVIDDNTSACRITSLFNDRGDPIPLGTPEARMRALRDTESMLREGDLLFNSFFDSHIAIAGNISFQHVGTESPSTQMLQLQQFVQLLRKQHIFVDAYVNVLNGQIEGNFTSRTRLLVKGDFTPLNSDPAEKARVEAIKLAYDGLEKQAIANGMFVISAENFAALIGYRPPQSQLSNEAPIGFRPLLPFVNPPRLQAGPPGQPAEPPMPKEPEPKKE